MDVVDSSKERLVSLPVIVVGKVPALVDYALDEQVVGLFGHLKHHLEVDVHSVSAFRWFDPRVNADESAERRIRLAVCPFKKARVIDVLFDE